MPELPEVETLRRDLARTIVGRTFAGAELQLPKLFRPGDGLAIQDLLGRRVEALERRAKLLIWHLSNELALVVHLKLAGQLVHVAADGRELAHGGHPVPRWGAPLPHRATHATFRFDDDSVLYLTDIRQFARLWLMPGESLGAFLARLRLGPEPLAEDFAWEDLRARLQRRSIPVKSALLNQQVVGGIGNIYADESLWEAGIHPLRRASSLGERDVRRLHQAIRAVLDYAVREGVAFVPQGRAVSDRAFPYCHGRAGTACRRCGTIVVKGRVNGRGTHWCPTCQPGPPPEGTRRDG